MIDLDHWSAAGLVGTYLSCLVAAAVYLARPKASHVLLIEAGMQDRPLSVSRSAIVVIPAVAWSAGLIVLETWAIGQFAPYGIKGLSCEPRWLPPISCDLPTNVLAAGQTVGLAALLVYAAIALLIWLTARHTSLLPFAMFALGLLAFGALSDLIAGSSASARSEILFGAVAAIQLTAAAGLTFALMVVPSLRATVLLRLHAAYLIVLALRLLGLLALMSLWPKVPSAVAVSSLVVLVLIPGVAAGAAIIASAPHGCRS